MKTFVFQENDDEWGEYLDINKVDFAYLTSSGFCSGTIKFVLEHLGHRYYALQRMTFSGTASLVLR